MCKYLHVNFCGACENFTRAYILLWPNYSVGSQKVTSLLRLKTPDTLDEAQIKNKETKEFIHLHT